MIKEKIEKTKALLTTKKEEPGKQNIQNLAVFLLILVITIIAINTIWNDKEDENKVNTQRAEVLAEVTQNEIEAKIQTDTGLEEKLKNILQKIDGVGQVEILLTYSQTSELVAMFNENITESSTQEDDSGGGTRKITQVDTNKEVIYEEENGKKKIVTEKIILPKIEGAIITAEGGNRSEIKANIIKAVEAATGLVSHKIQVFAMKT